MDDVGDCVVMASSWLLPSKVAVVDPGSFVDPTTRSPARLATPLPRSPSSLSLSLSSLPTSSPPSPPSALFAPSNQSFRLAFPSFIHDARHVALFSSPPFLREDYSILRPILPLLVEGRQRLETFLSVISSFFSSPLLDLLLLRLFEFELFPDESFVWEKKEGVVRRWKFYFALLHRDHVFSAGVRQVRVERTRNTSTWTDGYKEYKAEQQF